MRFMYIRLPFASPIHTVLTQPIFSFPVYKVNVVLYIFNIVSIPFDLGSYLKDATALYVKAFFYVRSECITCLYYMTT